jgi:tetratricopeptide (TPR) repeat protein
VKRDRWLLLAVLLFAAHRALQPMAETDLYFHLELGDLIRARHAIPFRNLFSFTFPDQPDPDLAWGFQVLVSLLHQLAGFAGIVVGKTVLFLAAVGLAWRAARRAGASPLATALVLLVVICATDQRLCERPHLVTFVGIGAMWNLILAAEERPSLRWWTVPLVWVWANFHAGVFFAPLMLGLYLVLAPDRRRWLPVLPLVFAVMFLTPAGTRLPSYLLWHTGLGATRNVEEFRRADPFDDPWFFLELVGMAVTALALRRRRIELLPPLIVAGLLALRSVRFVAEWSLLAAPYLALGASVLLRELKRSWPVYAFAGAVVLVVGLERSAQSHRSVYVVRPAGTPRIEEPPAQCTPLGETGGTCVATSWLPLGLDENSLPFAAIDYVTHNALRERLYEDLDVGCYLLWEGWPRFHVFQDARLPAYPDAFHRSLDLTPLDPTSFDALLSKYGVDAALLSDPDVNMRAGSFDPEEWALVYRDLDALVFVRRTKDREALIARDEIPLRVRFAFRGGAKVEPISTPPPRSPVDRCTWDRRLATALDAEGRVDRALDTRLDALERGCLQPADEAVVRFRLGARLQLAGDLARAAVEYDKVLAITPNQVSALINRGYARLVSDPAAARADFERAIALDPRREDARAGLSRLHH